MSNAKASVACSLLLAAMVDYFHPDQSRVIRGEGCCDIGADHRHYYTNVHFFSSNVGLLVSSTLQA